MDAAPAIGENCHLVKIGGGGIAAPRDRDGWTALGQCVGRHENLRDLIFHDVNSTKENLEALLTGASRNRSAAKLKFINCSGNWPLGILSELFRNNRRLSSLEMGDCNLSHDAVHSLSMALKSCTACSLEEIRWDWIQMGDALASDSIASLAGLSRLKKLTLFRCDIGRRGCDAMAAVLQNPACALQAIDLSLNRIGDEGLAVLQSAMAENGTITKVHLCDIGHISTAAWKSLATVLRSQTCMLDTLNLLGNIIHDDAIVTFSDALSGNSRLKELWFSGNYGIPNLGWASMSKAVCDKSSLSSLHCSNHTLQSLGLVRALPSDLASSLKMNESEDKGLVAHQKILMIFFGGDFSMEHFAESRMDGNVLPYVISWIGRAADRRGRTAMLNFLRRMPSLCGNRRSVMRRSRRKRKAPT